MASRRVRWPDPAGLIAPPDDSRPCRDDQDHGRRAGGFPGVAAAEPRYVGPGFSMPTTHVLFDFFGTLVAYSESRVEQGFEHSHGVLLHHGARIEYPTFLEDWSRTFDEFEARAQQSLDEYSMDDVCRQFLSRVLPRD